MKRCIFLVTIIFMTGCSITFPDSESQDIQSSKQGDETSSTTSAVFEKKYTNLDRLNSIPKDIVKGTPENDDYPPILHSDEFEKPVPLPVITTAGAEDSPFIPRNSDELYFVFIKDVREDVHVQIRDIRNGIWVSKFVEGKWREPELVVLQNHGSLALNGCTYVEDDQMYFSSAREGYTGMHWFTANRIDGKWSSWELADFKEEFKVGELHIHKDEIYYHSDLKGSIGGNDIWMMKRENGIWSNPVNIKAVNTEFNEGMPYISNDGKELWFNREYKGTPAVYRSIRKNGEWSKPELIISRFAGEPTLDKQGNLYFVHHYFKNGEMIEADIYIAYKKK